MSKMPAPVAPINPTGIHGYIDVVHLWVKRPLDRTSLAMLRSRCGPGGVNLRPGPGRFDLNYQQMVQLSQPSPQALAWFAERDDVHMNYVEIALDWMFDNAWTKAEAKQFVHQHLVKKRHRGQGIRWYEGTRYTDRRWAPNGVVVYDDKPSKVTGQTQCLHIEWRIAGVNTLRRLELDTVEKLIELDHRQFWKDRLLLYKLDVERLGRLYFNREKNTKRRTAWVKRHKGKIIYHTDRRTGQIIFHSVGSVQDVLDQYQRKINVWSCLIRLDIDRLLPGCSVTGKDVTEPSRLEGELVVCMDNHIGNDPNTMVLTPSHS